MYRLDSHIHCQYSPDSSTKIDDIIKKSIEDKIDIIYIRHEKANLSKMGEKFIDYLLEEVKFDK